MSVKSALWILVSILVLEVAAQDFDYYSETYDDQGPLNCSTTETIKGGSVTYSEGGMEGSVMTYHCDPGKFPHPVSDRICGADGEWSPMRLPSGRLVSRPTCKDMMCPGQLQLDNGDFWPRDQWFPVGMTQSFSCHSGFSLHGSEQRNCTLSGEWTGTTPICRNHVFAASECTDPGIPPGAKRSGDRFQIEDKVTYRCQAGMHLLGSAERVCLENEEWSGSSPRCQAPQTFDTPSSVAEAMAGSLAGVMDVLSPDSKKKNVSRTFGRSFLVGEVSRMNIYILLDTSGSIKKEKFELARNATIALIRKLDSYDVQLNFHVLSFASETKVIVSIHETDISGDSEEVIDLMTHFNYNSHGRKTGTNLYSALENVVNTISFLNENRNKNHFNETQNIIIIETDGYSNTGKKPEAALVRIRSLLGYSTTQHDQTHEKLLDVYVFGVGDQVNKDELNSLASKKSGERHFFVLKDFSLLGEVFNSIISDKSVTMCGIAQEDITENQMLDGLKAYTRPWHVIVSSNEWPPDKLHCTGSIVSQTWVLTAAHCFGKVSTSRVPSQLKIQYGGGEVDGIRVITHPEFNTLKLKGRNVSEFYDYDVALVETKQKIPLSWEARPICLPCTVAASRAMKKINSTCEQHREQLLSLTATPAFFIHKAKERKQTYIHLKNQRPSCVEKARLTLTQPTNVSLDEYVTENFLCSGGTERYQDGISCRGDSGGSLYLQKRKRFFQVGVLSWGTINVCEIPKVSSTLHDARDFHIDLFKLMPWLKQHLGKEIQFLP
ncbi:complement C2 [Poecilia reticulata]|uniref:complement C2 n=1 Tax=Poecilia reticulata TaxID=8081 RepID=UPI0004A36776|nr:PREDICTED: complement C2-like [Poecilia reticulata]